MYDIVIIAVMTVPIIFATIIIVRDLSHIWSYEQATIAELQIAINDIFMPIIFAELMRLSNREPMLNVLDADMKRK